MDNIGDGCYKCSSCLYCTERVCIYDLDDSLEVELPKEHYHKWDSSQEKIVRDPFFTNRQLAWIFGVTVNAIKKKKMVIKQKRLTS